ncbi:MAG: LLM class flavin-dependent oxidoreductase [Dehalococcoidia bacterium]|nr:LLM class flavin-dependent oxidoreductase [Dehalococcoidia bacterium]
MNGLGFAIVTFAPIPFREMGEVAQVAEDMGYERMYTSESLTDTLAVDMWIASQTKRITVASGIAIIYLRHPLIATAAATTISDISGGRFILGLGLGHAPRNEALGVQTGKPSVDLRSYIGQVRDVLEGRPAYPKLPPQSYQGQPLQIRRPAQPVPIQMAAVGPRMVELAGEIADGLICYLVPISGIPAIREGVARGAAKAGRDPAEIEIVLNVHVVVHDDLAVARQKAREALTYWVGLPGYNKSIHNAGFEKEADHIRQAFLRGDQLGIQQGMTDELLDQFCVLGPASRCKEQLVAIKESGVHMPIMTPDPIDPSETYRGAIERTLEAIAS